jgi:predicted phosphohydrolase
MSTKKIQIQVYSDLHLELRKSFPKIVPISPYLFLAGDISRFDHPTFIEFLSYCNENWEKIFYIFGNHDYWNAHSYIEQIKTQAKELLQQKQLTKIVILDNEFVSLNEDVIVFGSTFWTQSPFISKSQATNYVNDYERIRYNSNRNTLLKPKPCYLNPKKVNKMYLEDYSALQEVINATTPAHKIIVMTHFPPQQTDTSNSKYETENKLMKNYFSHPDGTINSFGDTSNVLCWISGHTHHSYDIVSPEGVRLISNQMGYISELVTDETGFNDNGLFELEY